MNFKTNFTNSRFQQYLDFLQASGTSQSTLDRKLSSLNSFQSFLIKKGYLEKTISSPSPLLRHSEPISSKRFLSRYLLFGTLIAIILGLGYGLYTQTILKAKKELAYTTATNPVRAGRILSFQGRLTDSVGNPIIATTDILFKLYTTDIGGTELYSSSIGNSQTVTPDDNGIFSVVIGKSHGTEIPSSVFSENPEVWLEITAGNEIMTPRQQIATVGYALNSETLQGLPPSASGLKDTVLVIDHQGNLNLGETSPTIKSTSGIMAIEGQALLLKTSDGSGGNITINPDGSGSIRFLTEGTSPSSGGFIDLSNANIAGGNLINSQINNDNRGYNFLSFQNYNIGTTTLSTRFSVNSYGSAYFGAGITTPTITMSTGASNGYILQSDTSGNASWVPAVGIGGTYTASNGINLSGSDFRLGGQLSQNTSIDLHNNYFSFSGTGNLGIGTTAPTQKLDVVGAARISVGITTPNLQLTSVPLSTGTTALFIDASGNLTQRALGTMAFDSGTYDNYNNWQLQSNGANTTTIGSGTTVNFVNGVGISLVQSGSTITINNSSVGTTYTAGVGLTLSDTNVFSVDYGTGLGLSGNKLINTGLLSLNSLTGNLTLANGTDTTIINVGNTLYVNDTSTLQSITSRGATTTNQLTINYSGAPFILSSGNTSTVTNLSADLLDGRDSTYFLNIGQTGSLPYVNNATDTTLTRSGTGPYTLGLNLGNANTWTGLQTFSNNFAVGSSALITNLNAQYLNGLPSSAFLQVGATGNFITTLTQGVGISITGTGIGRTIALTNTGVTPATYGAGTSIPTFTVDAQGRITSASQTLANFESPLTFNNGLTRTANTISLGGTLNQNTTIGTSSFSLSIGQGNTQALFISAGGNVGVGTTNPGSKLDIIGNIRSNGTITGQIFSDYSDSTYRLDPQNSTTSLIVAGNVGIGTTAPTQKLDINGSLNIGGSMAIGSTQLVANLNSDLLDGYHASSFLSIGATGNLLTDLTAGVGISISGTGIGRTIALTNTGVTPATYGAGTSIPTFTVDAQGRITSASSIALPAGVSYTASNGVTQVGNDFQLDHAYANTWTALQTFSSNFAVGSSALITNLNAQYLNGLASSAFMQIGQTGSLPYVNDATNTTLTRSGTGPYTLGLNLANANTWTGVQTFSNNFAVGSTALISSLNADLLDGNHASAFVGVGQTANFITTLTQGVGISITGTGVGRTIALTNTAVTPGTYGSGTSIPTFTVDAQGRITSAASIALPVDNNTTYTAGLGLTLSNTNVFSLDLASTNTWTGLQTFSNNFNVGSSALITNLNAQYLNGLASSAFMQIGQTGSLPYVNNATDSTLTRSGVGPYTLGLNLGNANTWTALQTFSSNFAVGSSALITNLNSDLLDGYHANNLPYDNYGNWQLQSNGANTTAIGSGTTVNFVNGVGISLVQSGSTITINNSSVGTTYTAGLGLTLSDTNVFSLNLAANNTWTGVQTFSNNFAVGSSALITNLNAQYLNGLPSSAFLQVGATGNFITTLTQGVGISITGTGIGRTIALTNTGVTPATYGAGTSIPTFTVDAQGRITSASSIALPAGVSYTASNGVTQVGNDFQLDHAYANTWTALQTFSNLTIGGTFISVGSTNLVTNLNANYLNGHSDSYFLDLGDTGSFIQSLTNGGAISITGTGVGRTLAVNFNTTNLQLTANQLNTIQNIDVTAQPTFARLGIGSTNSLYALNVGGTTYTNNLYTSGNVGIGTTNPLGKLHIQGTPSSGTRVVAQATGTETADFADFDFYNSDGNVVGAFRYVPVNGGNYGGSNSINFINVLSAPLTFGTNNTVRMTIDPSGNLSLTGAASIGSSLSIGTITSISDNNLVLTSNSGVVSSLNTTNWDKSSADDLTSISAGVGITISGSGNSRTIAFDGSQVGNMTFGSGSTFTWTFNAGATQAALTFKNGLLGLGTTDPRTALEINGTIASQKFVDLTGYDTFFIDLANSDYNSSSMQLDRRGSIKWNARYATAWTTIDNGFASKIESGLDGLLFATSIGSTATSSPITNWNQNLFLAGTGNVGIGTTSPSAKLEITATGSTDLYGVKSTVSLADGDLYTQNQYAGYFHATSTGTLNNSYGVYAVSDATDVNSDSIGVYGQGINAGIYGTSDNIGVNAYSTNTGISTFGNIIGIQTYANSASGYGIYTYNQNANGYALYSSQGKNYFSGNVGIGTTSPRSKLDILGALTIGGTQNVGLQMRTNTDLDRRILFTLESGTYAKGTLNGDPLVFEISGSEAARFNSSGYLGIGTTNPLSLLHIGTTTAMMTMGNGGTMSSMDFLSMLNSSGTYNDISTNAYWNGSNWYQRNPNSQSWLLSMPSRNDNTGAFDIIGKSTGMGSTASAITWNYLFKITPNGNVGIGYTTAIPDNKLDVFYSGTSHVAHFKNGSNATTAPVLALQIGNTTTSNNFVTFLNPSSTAIGRIRAATSTTVAYATTGTGDFAEYINGDEATQPGDIIAYHSQSAGKARPGQSLAGIYSTYGTFVAGEGLAESTPYPILLAMSGITQVKVNSSNGSIAPGDPITLSSNTIGIGAKATTAGYIVARAMETYSNSDPSQSGLIKAQVSLSYYDPDLFLTDTGEVNVNYNVSSEVLSSLGYLGAKNEIEAGSYTLTDSSGKIVTKISQFAKLAAAKIETGLLTAKSIIVDNLAAKKIASETIITGDITATTATVSGTLTTDKLSANEATISTLYADNIISKDGSFQNIFAEKISSLRDEIKNIIAQNQSEATPSAIMADASTWDTSLATDSANLDLANLTISDNLVIGAQLIVSGNTKLDTASVQNTLTVGQIAINSNIIETAATDLYIQPSALATIHFLNDRLVLSPDGNVTINGNLNVSGSLIANLLSVKDIQTETLTAEKINVATVSALPNVAIADASTASATATSSATIATNATAGSVTLNTGSTEIIIENSRLTPNSMVYLTPNASTQNQVLYVKNKNNTSFTIAIDQALDHDVDINWWLIN